MSGRPKSGGRFSDQRPRQERQFADAEPKGEVVILLAGATEVVVDAAQWHAALAEALADQPLRSAVDAVAAQFGLKRKDVYDAALALKAQE